MFTIRKIYDLALPVNGKSVARVQQIMREQFPGVPETVVDRIPEQIRNPLQFGFRTILIVIEDQKKDVRGFALVLDFTDLSFCYLDFMSAAPRRTGGGIGGALYDRVREEATLLGAAGVFFECLPDDPALCANPDMLKQNAARLKFYERYGARPIVNTSYETPITPGTDSPPYLVFDDLGQNRKLSRDEARRFVRAILERKYRQVCPKEYVEKVVASFRDDPVRLRDPKYTKVVSSPGVRHVRSVEFSIALVVNDRHKIHHVHERGYVETPVRVDSILKELDRTELFDTLAVRHFPEKHILDVHDRKYYEYFKRMCAELDPGESVYPYVFPIRNAARPPHDLPVRAGYYCIDTFTPLNRNAYLAAKRAVDCALTASEAVLSGYRIAYALVRPPGHHAERRAFGGFCYFNSAAIAAHHLSALGKVAVLDIDYHHGNGTQEIFYERSDVLTVSIHGHPHFAYPYFTGFADETGAGAGEGFNHNLPLVENVDGAHYREALKRALGKISRFAPRFLVVSLGLDTAKGDPTGSWTLRRKDFEANGEMIGSLKLPLVVVQEGGYSTRVIGSNARHFFLGLWAGVHGRRFLPDMEGSRKPEPGGPRKSDPAPLPEEGR